MIKVYATTEIKNNLITTIPFKGVQVRVEFAGGNSMKNIPAKFYTRDPFTQRALDSSDQLGRLYYHYQDIKEAEDAPAVTPAVEAPKEAPSNAAPQVENPEEAPSNAAPQVENPEEVSLEAAGETPLEFGNLGEAITYIASKYGEQVETENAARKFIHEKEGIKVVIHKG